MATTIPVIEYREFYDFPRAFLVVLPSSRRLMLVCPFLQPQDDYADYFDVYDVPDRIVLAAGLPWDDALLDQLDILGRVAVSAVTFDSSKRRTIVSGALEEISKT